jgi:hypothetical protein
MRTPFATLCAFAALAAPAAAQGTATATPNTAGAGTKLHTSVDATQPPISGRIPTQTVLSIQSGYGFDAKAVAKLCTAGQASQDKCPSKSKIGTATVAADYQGTPITIPIQLYLSKPSVAGDLAGFQAIAQIFGPHAVVGRIVKSTTMPYGISVVLPSPGGDAIASFGATFKSFSADFGVSRVIKKTTGHGKHKHVKKTRHYLIRNPASCGAGTWASNAVMTFSDGTTAEVDAPISCVS